MWEAERRKIEKRDREKERGDIEAGVCGGVGERERETERDGGRERKKEKKIQERKKR